MDKLKIEELYQQIATEGLRLQNLATEIQKKNGVIEFLFIQLQKEINKEEKPS